MSMLKKEKNKEFLEFLKKMGNVSLKIIDIHNLEEDKSKK